MTPEIFAPGIVSTKEDETAFEISYSGKEIVFIRKNKVIILTMNSEDNWNKPAVAPDESYLIFSKRLPKALLRNNLIILLIFISLSKIKKGNGRIPSLWVIK
ncbi:MAG: hypothetical protein K8R53_03970 [Bacteroidales bacterium]|nr:hypothetical protein [Bacteroidales bacterium]